MLALTPLGHGRFESVITGQAAAGWPVTVAVIVRNGVLFGQAPTG